MDRTALLLVMFVHMVIITPIGTSTQQMLSPCPGLHFEGTEWSGDVDLVTGSGTEDDPYRLEVLDFDLRTGRGLTIANSSAYIVIHRCRFTYGNRSPAISIHNSSNVLIEEVLSFRCMIGIEMHGCSDVRIMNSTVYGAENGVEVHSSRGLAFERVYLTYSNADGLSAKDSSDLSITDSWLDVNSPRLGSDQALLLEGCTDVRIVRTTFRMNYGDGITVLGPGPDGPSRVIVEDSLIDNNVNGIWAQDSTITVSNSTILRNTHGIFLLGCSDSLVRSCEFREDFNSVTIYGTDHMGVEDCLFSRNEDGVTLKDSDRNHVAGNEFRNNTGSSVSIGGFGEGEDGSEGNIITGNRFIDHKGIRDEVLDQGSDNRWNDDNAGNYWSLHQGPDQDSDGIVDVPRTINGLAGSSDLRPMVIAPDDDGIPQVEEDEERPNAILLVYAGVLLTILALLILAAIASIERTANEK